MIFYVIEARRKRIIGLNGSLIGLILQVNAIFNPHSFFVVLQLASTYSGYVSIFSKAAPEFCIH